MGMESFRVLIALSVQYGFELHHVDVQTAFLNGDLEEEVFMKQPKGYATEGKEDFVCKLKKCLYGLKKSSRCWNATLDCHLKDMGFYPSVSDSCIYVGEDVFSLEFMWMT